MYIVWACILSEHVYCLVMYIIWACILSGHVYCLVMYIIWACILSGHVYCLGMYIIWSCILSGHVYCILSGHVYCILSGHVYFLVIHIVWACCHVHIHNKLVISSLVYCIRMQIFLEYLHRWKCLASWILPFLLAIH